MGQPTNLDVYIEDEDDEDDEVDEKFAHKPSKSSETKD